jgi:hypothetical protein
MALRDWRFRRVLGLSVLWMAIVLIILLERSIAFARQSQPLPTDDFYVVLLHLPGGLWTVLGPPVLLTGAWLTVRRSRPAS